MHARHTRRATLIQSALTSEVRVWAARAELNIAAGTDLHPKRFKGGSMPKTRQVPLMEQVSAAVSTAGTAKRWLARRLGEIRRLGKQTDDGGDGEVERNVAERAALVQALSPPPWWVPREFMGDFVDIINRSNGCILSDAHSGPDKSAQNEEWEDLISHADAIAAAAELEDERSNAASWTGWVERSLQGGVKAGHEYVSGAQC